MEASRYDETPLPIQHRNHIPQLKSHFGEYIQTLVVIRVNFSGFIGQLSRILKYFA